VKQIRKGSLTETLLNTAIGYTIAVTTQVIVFPRFGIHAPLTTNMAIGVVFTVVSIARGYAVRRLFEALRVNSILT
jgi:hypothetical protein